MLPPTIEFSKLNSAGNDFICLDNTKGLYLEIFANAATTATLARALCRRGLSIGADGLIVANHVDDGDSNTIIARFLEPDGSESRLCGNGTACFTYWAIARQLVPGPDVQVITQAGTANGRLVADNAPTEVRVCIPNPTAIALRQSLELEGTAWPVSTVDIGVPHAVIFVEDIEEVNVAYWGRLIRHHPRFAPLGINANFVQLLELGHLAIRTFEFGVEGETLACGTGSAAAAIIACLERKWDDFSCDSGKPVEVLTRSGDLLRIWFKMASDEKVNDVCMESIVHPVYEALMRPEMQVELARQIDQAANLDRP